MVRFADTMKMSTYLVAFVVGRIDETSDDRPDPAPAMDRPRQKTSRRVWPGHCGRVLCFFERTMGFPIPVTSSTYWPSRTSPQGPWKTWVPLPSVKRPC